jgi:hypothetical protein
MQEYTCAHRHSYACMYTYANGILAQIRAYLVAEEAYLFHVGIYMCTHTYTPAYIRSHRRIYLVAQEAYLFHVSIYMCTHTHIHLHTLTQTYIPRGTGSLSVLSWHLGSSLGWLYVHTHIHTNILHLVAQEAYLFCLGVSSSLGRGARGIGNLQRFLLSDAQRKEHHARPVLALLKTFVHRLGMGAYIYIYICLIIRLFAFYVFLLKSVKHFFCSRMRYNSRHWCVSDTRHAKCKYLFHVCRIPTSRIGSLCDRS